MATRSAHPGDILGRSLSNIVLKTAQACSVDRTPEGHSAFVLLFGGICVLIMDGFRYRMDSDILRARQRAVGRSCLSCTVLVWMRRGGSDCCASDGEERKERCKLPSITIKHVTPADQRQ